MNSNVQIETNKNDKKDIKIDRRELRQKTVSILTLGCKVNQYETEAMMELFESRGYNVVDNDARADIYVINTCTVTSLGDKKSRQFIRRSKRTNGEAIIAVVGCYSQVSPEEVEKIEGVNVIIGTNNRKQIVDVVEDINVWDKIVLVDDIMKVTEFEELKIDTIKDKTRAFLKIQEGCNQYCSYCIIPYARGPIRSRQPENVISEVKRLAESGFKEVVLTGIHVASYGKDLECVNLIDVLKKVHDVEGIERIRLSSVEPRMFSEEFITAIKSMPKFCNHFHLSLQSGSDTVLKRMNRKYTTEEYANIVDKLRVELDNPSFTTDIIVGFPGETDQEFEETYAFAKRIGFSQIHVFKYSTREGTPAAKMPDQVPGDIKTNRSAKLTKLVHTMSDTYMDGFIGKKVQVLLEGKFESMENYLEGLDDHYMRICVEAPLSMNKTMQNVVIKERQGDVLIAELL